MQLEGRCVASGTVRCMMPEETNGSYRRLAAARQALDATRPFAASGVVNPDNPAPRIVGPARQTQDKQRTDHACMHECHGDWLRRKVLFTMYIYALIRPCMY